MRPEVSAPPNDAVVRPFTRVRTYSSEIRGEMNSRNRMIGVVERDGSGDQTRSRYTSVSNHRVTPRDAVKYELTLWMPVVRESNTPAARFVPMNRADPAGIRLRRPRQIDVVFERSRDGAIGCCVRPRPSGRRHRARAELADHALPGFRVGARTRRVQRVERKPGGPQRLVVTGDAVLFEESLGCS